MKIEEFCWEIHGIWQFSMKSMAFLGNPISWWFGTCFLLGIVIPTDSYFSEGLKPPASVVIWVKVYVCILQRAGMQIQLGSQIEFSQIGFGSISLQKEGEVNLKKWVKLGNTTIHRPLMEGGWMYFNHSGRKSTMA